MVTRLEFCLGQLLPPFPGGLWTASQHHEGIQRLLVLLAGLPVYSVPCVEPLGAPQLYWPQASPRHPLLYWVSFIVNNCMYRADIFTPLFHHLVCPHDYVCLSAFHLPGGQTFILSLYFRISQSPLRLETLPASLVKVTLFAKSGGALEI